MKYIIMCGGEYDTFQTPKALSVINGEKLVERTIRLLRERGIKDISISATDPQFDYLDVPKLVHENSFKVKNGNIYGYWVDAYFPTDEPTTYLHGDVYYTEAAINKILDFVACENTFIGNEVARNKEHKNWGEPFGWIIVDQKKFRKAIDKTKQLQDEGKLERGYAISWELYRVFNKLDPNKMYIYDNTYLSINDLTDDVDTPSKIEILNNKIKGV